MLQHLKQLFIGLPIAAIPMQIPALTELPIMMLLHYWHPRLIFPYQQKWIGSLHPLPPIPLLPYFVSSRIHQHLTSNQLFCGGETTWPSLQLACCHIYFRHPRTLNVSSFALLHYLTHLISNFPQNPQDGVEIFFGILILGIFKPLIQQII